MTVPAREHGHGQQLQDAQPGNTYRRPDYVIVVNASDWARSTSPPPGPTSGTPCTPATTGTTTPNPAWKPNHNPDRR